MINIEKETQKLAKIQRELIGVAQEEEMDMDVIISIRNGVIVFSKGLDVRPIKIEFKEIFDRLI